MNIDVPASVGTTPLDRQLQYQANHNVEAKSTKLFIRLTVSSEQIFSARNLEKKWIFCYMESCD